MLVVFDLDGTLADSRRDLADSANEMLAEFGAAPLDEARVGHMVGTGAPTLVARVLAAGGIDEVPPDALARFLTIYDRRLLNHTRLYPGIPEVLAELSPWVSLALLTNKPLEQSLRMLEAFGLTKYFALRAGGDGPWPRKPSPEGLQWLMRQVR
jgi:phosphoglycolate phosphatase